MSRGRAVIFVNVNTYVRGYSESKGFLRLCVYMWGYGSVGWSLMVCEMCFLGEVKVGCWEIGC